MQRKKTRKRCSVEFCGNRPNMKSVSFFRYPVDVDRLKIWIKNCNYQENADDLKYFTNLLVCGDHFESNMFLNRRTKNRLVFNAVPTLFSGKQLFIKY